MLKNITLSILCVFCINFTAKAQFSIDDDSLFTDGYVAGFVDLSAHTKIRNNTMNPDTIVWFRTSEVIPATWTSAVCDINLCHAVTVNTATFVLAPNSFGELSFHFYTGMVKGFGKMIVRFSKKSDPTYFIDVVVNCQAYGLNINTVENTSFQIFPNPAISYITIGSEKIQEGTFEIINLMGQTVMNNTFNGAQKIDVSSLAKGIYSITIQNKTAIASSKLIIQ